MEEGSARHSLKFPNFAFSDAVLEVRIDTTKCNLLALCVDVGEEGVVGEAAVVAMVVFDVHSVGLGIVLKGMLGLEGLGAVHLRLKVDITQSAVVVDKDGGCVVAAGGRDAFDLANEPWGWGSHLIDRDALSGLRGELDASKRGGRWFGAPRSFGGFAVEAAGALGNPAIHEAPRKMSMFGHELNGREGEVGHLVVGAKEFSTGRESMCLRGGRIGGDGVDGVMEVPFGGVGLLCCERRKAWQWLGAGVGIGCLVGDGCIVIRDEMGGECNRILLGGDGVECGFVYFEICCP